MPSINRNSKRPPWQGKRRAQQGRKKRTKNYDSPEWRKLRRSVLNENPLCVECEKRGVYKPADVVDHITPYNQGGSFWDRNNLQGLCHSHHNKKSARERHQGEGGA
ncbi:HNH endonuclease [Sanyastnella coralliicola]|uniref:HNH endonuclease n=1 Tax=Sanyastnella coralliicola TaxID=3069118 RepID=UPI003313091E